MDSRRQNADPHPASWTPREIVTALFFLAFLAWQIVVPAVKLAGPRPVQFGWQMFSGLRQPDRISVVLRNGEVQAVQPTVYLEVLRSDLRFERALARHLCRTDPRVAAVRLEPQSAAATVLRCRR